MNRPEDDDLSRLLAEGLDRHAGAPVDTDALVSGARRGAARIRRRRTTALTAAALLVVVVPAGVAIRQSMTAGSDTTASASRVDEAAPAAGQADSGSAFAEAVPSATRGDVAAAPGTPDPLAAPSSSSAAKSLASLPRNASGAVAIPDDALLAPDSLGVGTRVTDDTGTDGVAAATPSQATCGRVLAPTGQAGGRTVHLTRAGAPTAGAMSTVRVFSGDAASAYLRRAGALGCLTGTAVPGADEALVGRAGLDRSGRPQWFAVAHAGRAVTEVWVAVPAGAADGPALATRLLADAVERLAASGVPAAAAADPGLG